MANVSNACKSTGVQQKLLHAAYNDFFKIRRKFVKQHFAEGIDFFE
jgi:hypothetical protein